MLFNSIAFLLFLPLVFCIYWWLGRRSSLRVQNTFIVIASYVFYGWWDWRFLFLIAFTTYCSYLSGLWIDRSRAKGKGKKQIKAIAAANIVLNLGILCLFKYFNFFQENLIELFAAIGYELDYVTLNVLLPVGISFYTFQALSYTIDVYRKRIETARDSIAFFAFVSFFPQLVAGPIERATNLYPQFLRRRTFDYAEACDGCRLMLWGFFKKLAVADSAAAVVNVVFADVNSYNATTLLIGAILFAFQIYGDFSGYSDIAMGTSKLFGIRLMKNFNLPYFSRDIAEFWRRWHISLNTWFRDYVYIPLGGSRVRRSLIVRNTFAIFLLSGLWHGANWTFITWGAYHAALFLPLILLRRNRKYTDVVAAGRTWARPHEVLQMGVTFLLVTIGWIIFRATDIHQALHYIARLADLSAYAFPNLDGMTLLAVAESSLAIFVMLFLEWKSRMKPHPLCWSAKLPVRWCGYLLFSVWSFLSYTTGQAFIYFQF